MGYTHSEDWDQFISKIQNHTPQNRAYFIERCTLGNGRIGMIVGLAADWRAKESAKAARIHAATRHRKMLETLRWIPAAAEFRPYVSLEYRATMPEPILHPVPGPRRRENNLKARRFFHSKAPGALYGRRIDGIVRRTYRLSAQAWAGAHPYGPPPSEEELDQLRAHFINRTLPKKKPIGGFNPAGMTPERAIEIAERVLGRVS